MVPDSRWLDMLKASGWQQFAVAVTCTVFVWAVHWGMIPNPPQWMIFAAFFGAVLFWLLTVTSIVAEFLRSEVVQQLIADAIRTRWEQRWLRNYIPTMSIREKEIIAYLLAKNQRTFVADRDGGYAMPLISHKIVVRALQPGQVFTGANTPFVVPDHIWKTLNQRRADFPTDTVDLNHEPWRVHWMAR